MVSRVDIASGAAWPARQAEEFESTLSDTDGGAKAFRVRGRKAAWSWSGTIAAHNVGNLGVRVVARPDGGPAATLRVWFRAFKINGLGAGYLLSVHPQLRRYRVARYIEDSSEPLVDWVASSEIAPPPQPNVIEVRAYDDDIAILFNGHMTSLIHDASFGRGDVFVGVYGPTAEDGAVIDVAEIWSVRASAG